MRIFLSVVIAAFLILSMSHCTKSDDVSKVDTLVQLTRDTVFSYDTVYVTPKDSFPIVGEWVGSQSPTDGTFVRPLYYTFSIRSDNSILMQGQGNTGETFYGLGTWSMIDSSFSAQVTTVNFSQSGVQQNITADYSPSKGTLTNGHIASIGQGYTATFFMNRTN